jgi:DNA-binding winged helix-turn-helix (wHTH) protein/predicted ATPase
VSTDQTIRFGRYCLHPTQGLTQGRREIRITPKSLSVLCTLVERSGDIVSKEELFRAVWPDTVVSDSTLTSCIKELRKALRDNARAPRYIETLHRRGFRFLIRTSAPALADPGHGSAQVSPPLAGPLVGRDAALRQMSETLSRIRGGARQIVFVTGEPGIGKTSLVDLFLSGVAQDSACTILRGECVEHYGAGEAYQPLLEALTRFGRQPGREDFTAALRRFAPLWLAQLPALQDPSEGAALQLRTAGATPARMLRELTDVLEAITSRASIVLCLEDLHWSDTSTLDWIASFARRPERSGVLLVGTYRSGEAPSEAHSPDTLVNDLRARDLCAEVVLSRLDRYSVKEYVTGRFPSAAGTGGALQELARVVHQHTQGNPLFVVNVLNDLIARGVLVEHEQRWLMREQPDVASLGIPLDIRRTIERTIDRLDVEQQRLLEVASISGGACSAAAIAAGAGVSVSYVEARLGALARRHVLVREVGTVEWPDGTVSATFEFLHAMYREVLSRRLSPGRRAALHHSIGTRLEAAFGERAPQIAAELAVHFDEARDVPRAVVFYQHAAETDRRRNAHEGAEQHFRRALALLEKLPASNERSEREIALRIGLATVLMQIRGWGAPEVEEAYALARELCQKHGATQQLFPALWNLWVFYIARGRIDKARTLADTLTEQARQSADPVSLLQAHHANWTTLYTLGDPRGCVAHATEGIRLYEPDRSGTQTLEYGSHDTGVCARMFCARALVLLGRTAAAARMADESIALARELAHPFSLAFTLMYAADVHLERGDAAASRDYAAAAREIAEDQSFGLLFGWASCFLGSSMVELGQTGDGLSMIREGIEKARSTGSEMFQSHMLTLLARAQARNGFIAEALRSIDEAFVTSARTGERFYTAELHRLKGELQLVNGADAESRLLAEQEFRKALDIARIQGAKLLVLRAAVSLGRLWLGVGLRDEARRLVAEARMEITEPDLPELTEASALLADA